MTAKTNFANAKVSGISSKSFTGKAITQKITVKYGSKTLKNGTDYTVKYSANTKVGTAKVTITGKVFTAELSPKALLSILQSR